MKNEHIFNPLVCIVIPVFNGSNYIEESINSALSQSYKNITVVVVNDGSTDNGETRKIILKYKDKISYFEKPNGGVSSALNLGISKTDADYICWLSHDDLYTYDKVEKQINAIKLLKVSTDKVIVGCNDTLIDSNGKMIRKRNIFRSNKLYSSIDFLKLLLLKTNVNGCSLLIPRKALMANLFDSEYKFIQDYFMWVRLALQGYQFLTIQNHCVYNRIHPSQQTNLISNEIYLNEKVKFDKFLYESFKNLELRDYQKIIHFYFITSTDSHLSSSIKSNTQYKSSLVIILYSKVILIKNKFLKHLKKIYNKFCVRKYRR